MTLGDKLIKFINDHPVETDAEAETVVIVYASPPDANNRCAICVLSNGTAEEAALILAHAVEGVRTQPYERLSDRKPS